MVFQGDDRLVNFDKNDAIFIPPLTSLKEEHDQANKSQ